MLLLTYDISDDKVRSEFSNFIQKYGQRVQYSVYKIKNSRRLLDNISVEIEKTFIKKFKNTDSVYVFMICDACQKRVLKFGSATYEDKEVIYL